MAGLRLAPGEVKLDRREERWLVRLPDERVAWFAASEVGRRRLVTERRVLRLLEERCGFGAPRVLFEAPGGDFDVRTMVPGKSDPWRTFALARESSELAVRLGKEIGKILAEQHTRIAEKDVEGWLIRRPSWPEPRAWIDERLVRVIDDEKLIADADAVIAGYEALLITEADRALVHTDVGFHNLGIDPTSQTVYGLFDYDAAAWADRHHDFRYLVFDVDRFDLLEAALSVYEPAVGRAVSRDRIALYNAACAVTFLAYRAGTPPEELSCGRTLAQDLRWTRNAVARALTVGGGRRG